MKIQLFSTSQQRRNQIWPQSKETLRSNLIVSQLQTENPGNPV